MHCNLFLKKGWKLSMKLYKTIPVFLTIVLVGTVCSIISAALEDDAPPFDANDTVLVTETSTYVDYIPVYVEQDGNMKESLVNYIKDEIHEMPEYLKNKCMAVYIINDEQMHVKAEGEAYGLTAHNKKNQSAIYFNYDLLNTGGEAKSKILFIMNFGMLLICMWFSLMNIHQILEWKNYIKNIMMMKMMIFLSFSQNRERIIAWIQMELEIKKIYMHIMKQLKKYN